MRYGKNWICHPVRRYTGIPCLEFTERQKTGMRNARYSMKSRVDWATLPLSVKWHRVGGNVQRERAEYLILPRLAALSELGWADPEQHDFDAFMDRLYRLITVYDKSHYTYSEHVFQITENFRTDTLQDALEISLSTIGNRPIYYTTDGSQPDTASLIYTEPLIIREDTKLKAVIVTTEDTSSVFEEHIHVNKATFKPSWLANAPHENYTFNG